MKVYVVKEPQGEYEDYREPIIKVFLNKGKAEKFIESVSDKFALHQAKKCQQCVFMWENECSKGKEKPICYKDDGFKNCQHYHKYRGIYPLILEEYEIEDITDYTKQVRKEVCEEIRQLAIKRNNDQFYIMVTEILDQIQGE